MSDDNMPSQDPAPAIGQVLATDSSTPHELENFMEQVTSEMESEYLRIHSRAAEDPGSAGDQGEENWAELLREWLPPTYKIVTKGRILSSDGRASPQVDVIVLKEIYPEKLANKKLYLSAGVAAAFECKTTLTSNHIEQAAQTCVKIKSLYADRTGTPYQELHSPVIYGLLSHSHSWKGANSTPAPNVEQKWIQADHAYSQHPKHSLDLICVSDLGLWSPTKFTFIPTPNFEADPTLESLRPYFPDAIGTARVAYSGFIPTRDHPRLKYTPVGAYMVRLYNALAWVQESLRGLAEYFTLSGIGGNGEGIFRHWPISIYSEELQTAILRGRASGPLRNWDEWNFAFNA